MDWPNGLEWEISLGLNGSILSWSNRCDHINKTEINQEDFVLSLC